VPNKRHTALVIDDDPQVLNLLRRFIESNHGQALTAVDTEQGLALIRSHAVDIVLLDIVLPDEDGLSALAKIRTCLPTVPVIMMTGYDELPKAKECMTAGACDFITKPFDFEYLRTTMLANVLGG
jgi:DNA-binding NtrC family response regulator